VVADLSPPDPGVADGGASSLKAVRYTAITN
jgi:hypothetical protein